MQDEIEIDLESRQVSSNDDFVTSLTITAYLKDDEYIEKNTLAFRCNPVGTNYRSSYLRVTFDSWSRVKDIRDFIHHHFSESSAGRSTMTVPVEDGICSVTSAGGPTNEKDGMKEITIEIEGDRIEFSRSMSLLPYIHTYEESEEDSKDTNNVDKLLSFFDETIASHPDFQPGKSSVEDSGVLNPVRVKQNLAEVADPEDELYQDYEKAVREFEAGEYGDCIRDVGRCIEMMIEEVVFEVGSPGEVPDNVGRRINMLDKTEDGLPSFVAKTLSPAWWLRNKLSHPTSYEPSQEEAEYALHCFQVGVEAWVRKYLEMPE